MDRGEFLNPSKYSPRERLRSPRRRCTEAVNAGGCETFWTNGPSFDLAYGNLYTFLVGAVNRLGLGVLCSSLAVLAVGCAPRSNLAGGLVAPEAIGFIGSPLPVSDNSGLPALDIPIQAAQVIADSTSSLPSPAQVTGGLMSQVTGIDPKSTVNSKPGGTLAFDRFKLVNNVWGAPSDEALSSGIYRQPDGSFGWYWDRPAPEIRPGQTRVLPIYPCVRIGGSPWEASLTRFRPVQMGRLESLTLDVSFRHPQVPTGSHNLAYDLFFLETEQPSATPAIKAEVMIWILGTVGQPADKYKGDFSDGHNTYALYSWAMSDGRQYYAFVLKPASGYEARHVVDAKKLMDRISLRGDWWVHGIELGSEVTAGTGRIEINHLGVNLNGTEY